MQRPISKPQFSLRVCSGFYTLSPDILIKCHAWMGKWLVCVVSGEIDYLRGNERVNKWLHLNTNALSETIYMQMTIPGIVLNILNL